MKAKEKIVCSTCGAPFHGLTECKPDAPRFVQEQKEEDDRIISAIVDILSPLTHRDRDRVLDELKRYRSSWFNKEER